MQATITYLLSEQAQRAYLASTGLPIAQKQTVTEEIPNELAQSPLAKIAADGSVHFDLTKATELNDRGGVGYGHSHIYPELEAVPASGLEALLKWVADIESKSKSLAADYARRQVEIAERDAKEGEARRLSSIAAQERQAAEDQKEAAKRAFIDQCATQWPDLLRQQYADGLLARRDALQLIADDAFAGLPDECPDSTVCRNRDCPCHDQVVQALPADVYASWVALRERLPEGHTVKFLSVRECLRDSDGEWPGSENGEESAGPEYYRADVTVSHGPFQFTRRVRL